MIFTLICFLIIKLEPNLIRELLNQIEGEMQCTLYNLNNNNNSETCAGPSGRRLEIDLENLGLPAK